ncbi:MAG: ABC transporter substrate-binding protein [Pseudonocardia sp.]|nr:ABC transporter substrate-binding protein [Pseudonocardia sp.]
MLLMPYLRRVRLPVVLLVFVVAAACAGPAPDAARPGTLVIAVGAEPDTLDPHRTTSDVANEIGCLVGGSLVARDPQGRLVPGLAERWSASDDGLTWTFTLRPGVRFHDGTPLRAQDYADTFRRARDPATASPVAGDLLGPLLAATAPDDATLVLALAERFAPLLDNLAFCGYLQPLPARVDGRAPVGVGPYRFVEWRTGERVVLARNADYTWGPEFAPGPRAIETVVYRFLPDRATRQVALESGEVDVTVVAARDVARTEGDGGFRLYRAPLAGAAPLGVFNTSAAPFDDERIRTAFDIGVDRDALIAVVAGGEAQVQHGPISRSVRGYWPGVERRADAYRPEEARRLLAEAGYGTANPLRVPLLVGSEHVADAEVLAEQLRLIGVEITTDVVDAATGGQRILAGEHRFALVTITYPNADVLHLLFHSTKGALPVARLADPVLDGLLDASRAAVDAAARREALDRAQERIVARHVVLPLYTPTVVTAVADRVTGVVVADSGRPLFHTATVPG